MQTAAEIQSLNADIGRIRPALLPIMRKATREPRHALTEGLRFQEEQFHRASRWDEVQLALPFEHAKRFMLGPAADPHSQVRLLLGEACSAVANASVGRLCQIAGCAIRSSKAFRARSRGRRPFVPLCRPSRMM
jgi:hypothetical protein